MRRWAPLLMRLVSGPGTAITSRPSAPAHHGDAAGREVGSETLGASETIGCRLARAHDGDGEAIVRLHASADPEALGRQGNLPQIRRVRELVAGDAHRRGGCLTLHTLSRDAHLMSMITTQCRPV